MLGRNVAAAAGAAALTTVTSLLGATAAEARAPGPVVRSGAVLEGAGLQARHRKRNPNFTALARCESRGNPRAVSRNGRYFGLYQFDVRTWRAVGGRGTPHHASSAEQTRRAAILYQRRGRSPWPVCGRFL